jgi:hypothetical protein
MKTHSFQAGKYDFSIQTPNDWLSTTESGTPILRARDAKLLMSAKDSLFSPAVNLLTAPIQKPVGDTQTFVNEWFEGVPIETMFPRFRLLSHRASRVSNSPAARFEFEFEKANHKWFAITLVVSDGQSVHVLDGSFLSSDRPAWHSVVNDILDSFRIS